MLLGNLACLSVALLLPRARSSICSLGIAPFIGARFVVLGIACALISILPSPGDDTLAVQFIS